jgi:hypothetical protein
MQIACCVVRRRDRKTIDARTFAGVGEHLRGTRIGNVNRRAEQRRSHGVTVAEWHSSLPFQRRRPQIGVPSPEHDD